MDSELSPSIWVSMGRLRRSSSNGLLYTESPVLESRSFFPILHMLNKIVTECRSGIVATPNLKSFFSIVWIEHSTKALLATRLHITGIWPRCDARQTAPLHHVISLPFESCLSHNPFLLLISLSFFSSRFPVQSSFPLERERVEWELQYYSYYGGFFLFPFCIFLGGV